ncbi:MAG: hypothetical protein CMF45_08245 [Legionellales bacterium]|nr:hypothetical protein [Legionellales bacterium]
MDLVVSLVFTLIVTVLFILVLRPVALATGLVDIPGGRKTHDSPTPVVGGIAMYLGIFFGGVLMEAIPDFGVFMMGASLLIVVGVIDDRFELPATVRLIAQTCAVLFMIFAADLKLEAIGTPLFFNFELGSFAIAFTILVSLAVINAFNIIDGIDGLAGGTAFITLSFMAILSIHSSALNLILLLLAVIIGFLICNAPASSNQQVKCFMGDSGSTFLGFSVVWLGISLSQSETNIVPAVTGLWLVAVPIYDVITSTLRRIFRGKSPFKPDRDHFHDVLMRLGFSARMTLLTILALSLLAALIGLVGEVFMVPDGIMFLLWLVCGVVYFEAVRGNKLVVSLVNRLLKKMLSSKLSQHEV